MKYQFERTDTFGGEANYSWVERVVVDVPDSTPMALLRAVAKHWAGWRPHYRCSVDDWGDGCALRPRGLLQVMFITEYNEKATDTADKPVFYPDVEVR